MLRPAAARHDRICSGSQHEMLDTVYNAWSADTAQGLHSLMIAADRDTVTALNQGARADRIRTGTVTAHGVKIADGAAGLGDRIITRRNDRTLRTTHGG